jgi:predicted NBD/HSP70 family sugar kinase
MRGHVEILDAQHRSPAGSGPRRGRAWLSRGGQFESQASVRQENLQRVLQLVLRDSGTVTRAAIARATGLTSATVSSLIAELITLRLVAEGDQAVSTGGKRATILHGARSEHVIVAIIVRTRSLRVGLLDLTGDEIAETTRSFTRPPSVDDLVETVRDLCAEAKRPILAIGVQVPGTAADGVVIESVQLGWNRLPVADLMQEALGAPVFVLNDVDAEALAEAAVDREPVAERLLVHLGEGVGAAATIDGDLVRGFTGRAGEIGHVRVLFEGNREFCACGLSGCLESTASMAAMLGSAFHDDLDEASVQMLADSRESRARMAVGARALSRALRMLAAMFDPEEILLGGSAPALGVPFLSMVRDEFEMYPAKGTAPVRIAYANGRALPFMGAAQFALRSELGVSWSSAEGLHDVRGGGVRRLPVDSNAAASASRSASS